MASSGGQGALRILDTHSMFEMYVSVYLEVWPARVSGPFRTGVSLIGQDHQLGQSPYCFCPTALRGVAPPQCALPSPVPPGSSLVPVIIVIIVVVRRVERLVLARHRRCSFVRDAIHA